jgi:hypothetical protein
VHCTSIALTHKIHTLSTLQSEMLGVAQQHRLFPTLGGACSATGLLEVHLVAGVFFAIMPECWRRLASSFLGRGWSPTFALFHSTRALH